MFCSVRKSGLSALILTSSHLHHWPVQIQTNKLSLSFIRFVRLLRLNWKQNLQIKTLLTGSSTNITLSQLTSPYFSTDCSTCIADISGAALSWFSSYLTKRIQSVIVDDHASQVSRLSYGAPQNIRSSVSFLEIFFFDIQTQMLENKMILNNEKTDALLIFRVTSSLLNHQNLSEMSFSSFLNFELRRGDRWTAL